ncbi:MAG: hypothetical protein ACXWF4_07495 [Candidatus Aminicenantales bacterium]
MKIAKPNKWSLIFILVVAAGVLFFAIRMYQDDIKAIKGFMASCEEFDKAISGLSQSAADDFESRAGDAAVGLSAEASLRLSSLIKNDAKLMDEAREVADLARKELESLRAYQRGIRQENADVEELAEGSRILTEKRKTAYARFQELGGVR